ncbi:hypothetical protein [Lysobacter sp. Root916]|uniref:hypothetical protein n=1 Tax=Lysobacter sp. Root916 TaxID=1736606 RepID=UPI0012F79B65|nr:hypothetical protein [Lysobacter sp. Root916]
MSTASDLTKRIDNFDQFLDERMPVLYEFAQSLRLPAPHAILTDPMSVLSGISAWLALQHIEQEDRAWVLSRVGYYIGELLVTHYSGAWLVCTAPASRFYGRYVVGQFRDFDNAESLADPFEAAAVCIDEPPGRSLENIINGIVASLRAA